MQQPGYPPPQKDRLTPWDWIQAGFWLAFGLTAGTIAMSLLVAGILLGLGVITRSDLRL